MVKLQKPFFLILCWCFNVRRARKPNLNHHNWRILVTKSGSWMQASDLKRLKLKQNLFEGLFWVLVFNFIWYCCWNDFNRHISIDRRDFIINFLGPIAWSSVCSGKPKEVEDGVLVLWVLPAKRIEKINNSENKKW